MFKFILVLAVFVGTILAQKSIGDVKSCRASAAATCLTQCEGENSGVPQSSWTSIKSYLDAKRQSDEQCRSNSLPDSTPCFAHKESLEERGGQKGPHSRHQRQSGRNLPSTARKPLECLHKCEEKAEKNCSQGCTGTPPPQPSVSPADRQSARNCEKSADQTFGGCIKQIFPSA